MITRTRETQDLHLDVVCYRIPEMTRPSQPIWSPDWNPTGEGAGVYESIVNDIDDRKTYAPEGTQERQTLDMLDEAMDDLQFSYDYDTWMDFDSVVEAWEEFADAAYELGVYDIRVRVWKDTSAF